MIVHGKDVNVFETDGVDDFPIICAKKCSISRVYDVKETTHYASMAKEFRTGMYQWSISLEGYTTVEQINAGDKIVFDYLLYGGLKTIKMTFTSNGVTKTLTGDVIFPDVSIEGDVADSSGYSMTLQGTGTLTLS